MAIKAPKVTRKKITDYVPDNRNANSGSPRGLQMLEDSLHEDGAGRSIVADKDGRIPAGNKTLEAAMNAGIEDVIEIETDGTALIVHKRSDWDLDDPIGAARRYAYRDNRVSEVSLNWDANVIASDIEAGLDLSGMFTDLELEALDIGVEEPPEAPEAQLDRAEELQQVWQVQRGQLWIIPSKSGRGEHHLLCGDSTNADDVARVMGGERAVLCHADPPYGMGKENEGILNDNLYKQDLDDFQMRWWRACRSFLDDNASAYIWGVAEDLWRLWYCAGLRDSERLTLRNEIVWDKSSGQGMESDAHRMYPTASERCLFFMVGEQGFSNNADNYWDKWDTVRLYLKEQRDKTGWDNAKCKELAGHSPTSGCHWFDASQWTMPTEDVYKAWQKAAKYDDFKREYDDLKREYDDLKREYDDLKREFYSTRAYFDNTHDSMTDVWQFKRVLGSERHDHATPKPVDMTIRCIKSSADTNSIVYDPFLGSGTTLVACEQTGRQGRGIEIAEKYCAVILQRLTDMGLQPELQQS